MDADDYTLQMEILEWIQSHEHEGSHALFSRGFFSEVNNNYPCTEREFIMSLRSLCEQGLIICQSGLGNLLRPRDSVLVTTILGLTLAGRKALPVTAPNP